MSNRFYSAPGGFDKPTDLPEDTTEQAQWIEANKSWWEKNPMRYDFSEEIKKREFSKEFYKEMDRRFFSVVQKFMPYKKVPFENLIPFVKLREKTCLEIGVGNGSHAQLLSNHAKQFVGIDLTEYAIKSTSARFYHFGLSGHLKQMNAEALEFGDNTFDFVWSWGVIHHSANTSAIVKEIKRVLRPGGEVVVMVYHRGFCYYLSGVLVGIFKGYFFKGKSIHQAVQDHTDGAIARYYTAKELSNVFKDAGLRVTGTRVYGQKTDILPIKGGKIKNALLSIVPSALSTLITNTLRGGLFLVVKAIKA